MDNDRTFEEIANIEPDSSIIVSHQYQEHQLQPEILPLPDYALNGEGYERYYYKYVRAVELALNDDEETANIMNILRSTLNNSNDLYNWLLLVLFMAEQFPHPADPMTVRDKYEPPGQLALRRAALMLVGHRGAVHGWSRKVPDIESAMIDSSSKTFAVPFRWAPHPITDGDSEFESDSSGHGADTDESGPRGVVLSRPPVTGSTTGSETSSSLSNDNRTHSRIADIFGVLSGRVLGNDFKLMKRFDRYLAEHNRERRQRRSIRNARRWARNKYKEETKHNRPLFNMEIKRAEALAAEKVRREIKKIEQINAEKRAKDKMERKIQRLNRRQQHLGNSVSPDQQLKKEAEAQNKIRRFRLELKEQLALTWSQYYGHQSMTYAASPSTVNDPSQKAVGNRLECWMTPVHWIKQNGPK